MTRKKILWLCSWYPGRTEPFNGDFIQRHARAAALFNDIHVIHAIEDGSGKIKKTTVEINRSEGLTEEIIYIHRKNSLFSRMIGHYRWLFMMRQAIKKYIRENGKPALVHVNIPMKAGIFGIWMKRKYGIPFVVTEHWGIYNDVEVLNYTGRSKTFRHYTKQILSKAARFISVSRYLAEGVNKLVIKKEFDVIPNTVNTDLFFYKTNDAPLFRFIHVSNMVPLKNTEGVLRAFKLLQEKYPAAELVLAGDTDPGIRYYAEQLGLNGSHIFFRGEVPYKQVADEMQRSHCLVLFSNIENSPCVIGEAFCSGLPVIATRVGGIPELTDESNSILVEPKDEQGLISAMDKMISQYGQYDRKKIAENAVGKFSYDVIGKKLDDIYEAVTGKP